MIETAQRIYQSKTITEAAVILMELGESIGLPKVGYKEDISLASTPKLEDGSRLSDVFGWPDDFVRQWEADALTFYCGVFRQCRFSNEPFQWRTDDADDDIRQARLSRREFALQGYHTALVVPLHHSRGRVGMVSWWGGMGRAELDSLITTHGPMLLAVGYYFNTRYCLFSKDQQYDQQLPSLSSREVAVLEMASGGSSDEEIADCLGLSFHTVRFHITNAVRKLGARNRIHAVALAAQVGIIGAVRALTPDLVRAQR